MQRIVFELDVVSPYAYLAFERLPRALAGLSYVVEYRPVLFAGMLKHWGQRGPAEVEPKRDWLYRHCDWIARQDGVVFERPDPHPFNPLAVLRLMLASAPAGGRPNRRVVELAMRHVWARGGAEPNAPEALAALERAIAPVRDPRGAEVKDELRALTTEAIERGVFGVPSFRLDGGELFWGQDALPMLADALRRRAAAG